MLYCTFRGMTLNELKYMGKNVIFKHKLFAGYGNPHPNGEQDNAGAQIPPNDDDNHIDPYGKPMDHLYMVLEHEIDKEYSSSEGSESDAPKDEDLESKLEKFEYFRIHYTIGFFTGFKNIFTLFVQSLSRCGSSKYKNSERHFSGSKQVQLIKSDKDEEFSEVQFQNLEQNSERSLSDTKHFGGFDNSIDHEVQKENNIGLKEID